MLSAAQLEHWSCTQQCHTVSSHPGSAVQHHAGSIITSVPVAHHGVSAAHQFSQGGTSTLVLVLVVALLVALVGLLALVLGFLARQRLVLLVLTKTTKKLNRGTSALY